MKTFIKARLPVIGIAILIVLSGLVIGVPILSGNSTLLLGLLAIFVIITAIAIFSAGK